MNSNSMDGVYETNPISKGYHEQELETAYWEDLQKTDRIESIRLRLVTDSGFPMYDVSYFHVMLNGKKTEILNVPFFQLGKKTYKSELINACQRQGIFIRNIANDATISILR